MVLAGIVFMLTLSFLWLLSLNAGLFESMRIIQLYFLKNGGAFSFVMMKVVIIYCLSLFSILSYFGIGEFGRKISSYKKSKVKKDILPISIAFVTGVLCGWFITKYISLVELILPLPSIVPIEQIRVLIHIINGAEAISLGFIFTLITKALYKFNVFKINKIPVVPNEKNKIVIGTKINGDEESWISLGTKSLSTGLLTTASTGSGKSSACLLPWTKQILENFDPKPSLIVIDPKDSFARDVVKLVKELNRESDLIHFTMDGKFRTNIIYQKNVLKNSGYSKVASMIQAASENFMGKQSGDAKFWSMKGYSLLKNMVIFCAGKYGDYFTLTDFYEDLIQSTKSDLALEIDSFLSVKEFDSEEKRNLEIAQAYFEHEFSGLDNKLKDSIVQSASTFLALLRDARVEKIFCPKEADVTFWGFDDIVDNGKIFVFGIDVQGLSGPMAIFMKLLYQRSVLNRIKDEERLQTKRLSFGVYDEYQSIVTTGGGQIEGDDDYAAKRREALGITIAASQSLSSLSQAIGNETGLDTLIQNFRNQIIGHSKDKKTVEYCKYFAGEVDRMTESQSYSESGSTPIKGIFGKIMTTKPTVSQSLNQNVQKVSRINGETLSTLNVNEAVGFFFNGVESYFVEKVGLKPTYLKSMRTAHKDVLAFTRKVAAACLVFFITQKSFGAVTLCSAVKGVSYESCTEYQTSPCMCGGTPPRPCVRHSYYFPQTFIEVTTEANKSFFSDLPVASQQLGLNFLGKLNHGADDMGGYFYHARVLQVPLSSLGYQGFACGGNSTEKMCFDAISEQVESWKTGSADLFQPPFLLWNVAIPACYKKSMTQSLTGDLPNAPTPSTLSCGFPLRSIKVFPPSRQDQCTGWGALFPRTGFVESSSSVGAALLAAKRIRSIASDVYRSTPMNPDEKWSMVYPNTSSCFREGKNLGEVEVIKNGNETGRLLKTNQQSFIFAVWKKMSCCKDLSSIAETLASKVALKAICQGLQ